jgi:hypothetical protein
MGWKMRQKNVLPWEQMPRQGVFKNVWEQKFPFGFPTPGAQSFAFESYGLVEYTPIGPSAVVADPIELLHPQLYVGQAVVVQGIPLQAGQVMHQPLIDPQTGAAHNNPGERGEPAPNTPY